MNRDDIPMFTIYRSPSDFPGRHVVRRAVIRRGQPMKTDRKPTAVCNSIDEARAAIPAGLTCVGRDPNDDPVIVETWL